MLHMINIKQIGNVSSYLFILHYDFSPYFQLTDVEALWKYLKQALIDAVEANVPKLFIRKHQRPKWFTPTIQHRLNQVHSLRRKLRLHPTEANKQKLDNAESDLQNLMKEAKCHFESSLVHRFANTHDNLIYKYLSSFSKGSSLPQTMYFGSVSGSSDQCKAQLFNNFFYSIFNNSSDPNEPPLTGCVSSNTLSNISFTPQDVYKILISLDPSKAMGTDNINPKLLKNCADLLCEPIYYLFKASFSNSYLPAEWRTHCITPIFKSGDRSDVSNYCPISLLCVISNSFEKIIFDTTISLICLLLTNVHFCLLLHSSAVASLY